MTTRGRFLGRERELAVLARAYQASSVAFVPIYGRRRVGKSELIKHFIADKPSVYFLGKKAAAGLQQQEFMAGAARSVNEPLLAQVQVSGWREAITQTVAHKPTDAKLVLVFDEFQWTVEASPELPSLLQELLDDTWCDRSDLMVIVCGSYLGFMEREVLGEKSPLFGRRSAQILLRPFSFREAGAFHPSWATADKARTYFVCGGIPLYHKAFDENLSIRANIETNLFDEFAPLFREPDFLLREELRELRRYHGILMAVATGHHTATAISTATGIDARKLPYYLRQLIDLRYVARRFPLTSRPPSPKAARYVLDDPLLRFWFRFVFPNLTYVTQMGSRESFRNLVSPELDGYWGQCFERLCREALPRIYAREGVTVSFEVGEYWDRDVQIDVVGSRKGEGIDIGECKWGAVSSAPKLATELERRTRYYPNPEGLTITPRLFLRRPCGKTPGNVLIHTLDGLYESE